MNNSKSSSVWMPLLMFGVATLFYLYEFFLRVSPNVLERELISAFHMDAKAFGFFSSAWYWAYAPLQLPVGAMTDKYGPRRLLTGAILVCALNTLVLGYTKDFVIGSIARFLIGAGSAFAFISCMKIVHLWFQPRWFALMTGMTLAIGLLGGAVGGKPLYLALEHYDWQTIILFLGWIGIGIALLAWMVIRDRNPDRPLVADADRPGFWHCVKMVSKEPQSWIVGIYSFFVTAPTDAFGGAWGVKFLTEVHGISRDMASQAAVTMTFLGMVLGSPLLGWFSEKIDSRKWPMAIAAVIAAITLTLIVFLPVLTGPTACVLFFIFGASAVYVLAFVMTRRLVGPQYVATAVGFVNMVSMFGSAILTYLIGYLLTWASDGVLNQAGEPIYTPRDYHLSLALLPIFYAVSAILVVPLIRDSKRDVSETRS